MAARDIALMNAVYPDVPAVVLPVDGGGTARFTEVSDTTAVAADVLSPKTFYKADGTKGTGSIETKTSSSMTVSGATVTAPAGYYSTAASKSVTTGTEGTPFAQVGTVTNHSVTITPKVTNVEGYISGGTHTGTIVNISASDLESGTKEIVANGTGISVSGYSTVDVSVTPNLQAKTGINPTTSSQTIVADTLETVSTGEFSQTGKPTYNNPTSTGYYFIPLDLSDIVSGGTYHVTGSGSYTNYSMSTRSYTIDANWTTGNSIPLTFSGYDPNVVVTLSATGLTVTMPTAYTQSDFNIEFSGEITFSGYDGLSSVQINAMPSGTAGTPTATKGTVSNHSVSVTPSVTNTTGYITGSTKTGTAVTVSASELVSGSETKTANGTYDVTNLAELVVNVSGGGGGGLVYESGTYTPASDIARPTISFTNTHTTLPIFIMVADATGTDDTAKNGNYGFSYASFYDFTGEAVPSNVTSGCRYALAGYVYRSSSTNQSQAISGITINTDGSNNTSYKGYWVTATGFIPSSASTSRYWRSGRTYKWIAVWKPST